jgi:hypothetical protein
MEADLTTFLSRLSPQSIETDKIEEFKKQRVFHFTTLDAFINIIKTQTLWVTNSEYMNDLFELNTLENDYEELFKGKNKNIIKIIKKHMNIFDNNIKSNKKKTYIFSLCKENDSIAMWKTYGKDGIALELDMSELLRILNKENINIIDKNDRDYDAIMYPRFGYAVYDIAPLSKLFDHIQQLSTEMKKYEKIEGKDEILKLIIDQITDIFYFFYYFKKDSNFKYENEFRSVFILDDKEIGKVEHFRNKNNLLIPYLILNFKNNNGVPLKSITINPEMKDPMYENGLIKFLETYDYNIEIFHTKNKIR